MKKVRFTRAARKHRIGKAHVLAAMNKAQPERFPARAGMDERLLWIAQDDRGLLLEIIGIDLEECVLIIHVMPYAYRRR